MQKIDWQNGTVVKDAFITIDGVEYLVTPKQMEGTTPLSADNLNLMQNNIEEAINSLSVDYITETGTTDGWSWRKWKSGRIEMRKFVEYSGLNMTSASAGTYYGASKRETLPFELSSLSLFMAPEGGSRSSGVFVYSRNHIYTSSKITSVELEFRAHASTSNANCGATYYIIGQL